MSAANPAVVVVAFHGAQDLDRCLAPIAPLLDVVVVDNSGDHAVKEVARRHGCQYVDSGANLGFGAGVNIGVSRLDPDADLLLLNPDAVITSAAVCALAAVLTAEPALAAVSPRLVDEDGIEQRAGWPFPGPARMWWEAVGGPHFVREPEDFVVGAALLIRRAAWQDVGAFDERFFLYAEEVDWQRRARAKGWTSRVVIEAVARHRGAGTSSDAGRREELFHAAIETYVRKWFGPSGWMSYRGAAVAGAAGRSLIGSSLSRRGARSRLALYVAGPRRRARLSSAGPAK
jgi:GT2 family glycosyltransferase